MQTGWALWISGYFKSHMLVGYAVSIFVGALITWAWRLFIHSTNPKLHAPDKQKPIVYAGRGWVFVLVGMLERVIVPNFDDLDSVQPRGVLSRLDGAESGRRMGHDQSRNRRWAGPLFRWCGRNCSINLIRFDDRAFERSVLATWIHKIKLNRERRLVLDVAGIRRGREKTPPRTLDREC